MASIDMRIFRDRHFTGTPPAITQAIGNLCAYLSVDDPIYIPCIPEGEAGECFLNVRVKVDRDGGELLYGWAIWEWRRVFVEAEHHAVWKSKDNILDITSHKPLTEQRILFLPDPGRHFDYDAFQRIPNVKRSLGMLSEVQPWLDLSDRFHSFIEQHSIGRATRVPHDRLQFFQNELAQAQGRIIFELARTTGPKDTCICRSGRQFRRCCRHFIQM